MSDKPELSITVDHKGEEKVIKMTYGLEMDLRRLLPDPASAMQLAMTDVFTQDYIIRRCLTDSKKMLKSNEELISEEEVDLDTETTDKLIMWVLEHQLYFFGKRANGIVALAARQKTEVPQHLSKSGLEDSTSPTPSAGPSDVSKETSTPSSGDTPDES